MITLHRTTIHYTALQYTPLHCTTQNSTTAQYTTLQIQLQPQNTTPHYATLIRQRYATRHHTTLHYRTFHHTILDYSALDYSTLYEPQYITLHSLHHHRCNCNYTTRMIHNTPQQLQLELHYNTSSSCRWGGRPGDHRNHFQPFRSSVDSLCHLWFTTANLS